MSLVVSGVPTLKLAYGIVFISDTDMTIIPRHTVSGTLEYSLNRISWTVIPSGGTTASSKQIYFRGKMSSNRLFNNYTDSNAWTINNGTNVSIKGNIQRLLNCENPPTSVGTNGLYAMFKGITSISDVSNLTLGATTISSDSYTNMFSGCSSLTAGPEILATSLPTTDCCQYMFYACPIQSVTVHFTAWNGNATYAWFQYTPSTGTFRCPAALPDQRNSSRIPSGWTKVDI